MTGARTIYILVVIAGSLLIRSPTAHGATPTVATPVPTLGPGDVSLKGEVPDSVPISLRIENRGREADRLLGASTPIAESVALHRTMLERGVRTMRPASGGLTIPGNNALLLEPGATHLMLVGLQEDLVQGRAFPLTLHFSRAGAATITVRVRRMVDAAGLTPVPPVVAGDVTISSASVPPAAAPIP